MKNALSVLIKVLIVSGVCFLTNVSAQPTDAQLKNQLMSPDTVSLTLGAPGTVEWSSTYKKYVWSRNFTRKLKAAEPGVFIIVKGYASYDVMGGRYVYWRNFITSNSYEGLPNLTTPELQALFKKVGVANFFRGYSNFIVGDVESIAFAPEPNFEWHTPNSVSFNIVSVYTARNGDKKERGEATYRIRIYRDNTKAEWRDPSSTRKAWKVL